MSEEEILLFSERPPVDETEIIWLIRRPLCTEIFIIIWLRFSFSPNS